MEGRWNGGKRRQAFKIVQGVDFIQVSDTGRTLQFNEDIQYAEYKNMHIKIAKAWYLHIVI